MSNSNLLTQLMICISIKVLNVFIGTQRKYPKSVNASEQVLEFIRTTLILRNQFKQKMVFVNFELCTIWLMCNVVFAYTIK